MNHPERHQKTSKNTSTRRLARPRRTWAAGSPQADGRLAGLGRIALGLSAAHTVEEVAEVIIREGLAVLGGNAASVALLTDDKTEFVTVRCHGYPPDVTAAYARYPYAASLPNADVARTGQALFLETQAARHARYPHLAATPTQGGRGAQVALPMMVQGRMLGGLAFSFADDRAFGSDDRAFLETIGQLCAQALEGARLYDAAQGEVAERAAAEIALRESEARHRMLAEALPQLVWIARADGGSEYYNRRWHQYTGYPMEEILERGWGAFVPPEDLARADAAWVAAVRTGEPFEMEYRIRSHGGHYRWFLARALPLTDEQGAVARWFGTCTDIHAQKEAEGTQRFLADLEEEMRAGADAEDMLGRVVDALGRHLQVSRCGFGEIDLDQDLILVHRDYSPVVPSMAGAYTCAGWGLPVGGLADGRPMVIEDARMDPRTAAHYESRYLPLNIRAIISIPIMKEGRQMAILAVQEADRPRRWTLAEMALLEAVAERAWLAVENARLRRAEAEDHQRTTSILESITDGFVSLDPQWRYTYVNQEAERLLHTRREDMIGRTVAAVFPLWDRSEIKQVALKSVEEGRPTTLETFTEATGVWLETRIYPASNGLAIYFRDITYQKRAESERQEAAARQRTMLRDVLASVTEGKLRLCERESDLPAPLATLGSPIRLSEVEGLPDLRERVRAAALQAGLREERTNDLLTATGEAGMNAVTHAGGGTAQVAAGERGPVQVRVEDQGGGITLENLPRATLARGYSTRATLGHGMKMMLETIDRLWLMTGPRGTTVVIEQDHAAPLPAWLNAKLNPEDAKPGS